MCNSCNNSLASALNNLFGSPCGCQNQSLASVVNNLFGPSCGCQNNWNNFSNGFVSGVNAVNASDGQGGCGCNCGCNEATPYYGGDNYYARQYALGPYSSGCGCNNTF